MVTCSHDHLSAPVSRFCHLIPLTCSSMSQRPLSVYFLCLCSPPISLAIRWGTSNQNFGKYRRARHCAASKRRAKFLGYKCLLTPAKRNASLVIRKCLSLRKPVELNTSLNTGFLSGCLFYPYVRQNPHNTHERRFGAIWFISYLCNGSEAVA